GSRYRRLEESLSRRQRTRLQRRVTCRPSLLATTLAARAARATAATRRQRRAIPPPTPARVAGPVCPAATGQGRAPPGHSVPRLAAAGTRAPRPRTPPRRQEPSALETPPAAPERAESKEGRPTYCGEAGPPRQRERPGTRREHLAAPPHDQRVDIEARRTRQSLSDGRARTCNETSICLSASRAERFANEQHTGG